MLATRVALSFAQDYPVLGAILIVPIFDTNPTDKPDPWGENAGTPGLTADRLLGGLEPTFREVSRDDWYYNPSKMPDHVVQELPPMAIALAKFDILYKQGKQFCEEHLQHRHDMRWKTFDGIHQVKDMDQVTAEGRLLREYIVDWCRRTYDVLY
jgi:acetyl esterase/lipase